MVKSYQTCNRAKVSPVQFLPVSHVIVDLGGFCSDLAGNGELTTWDVFIMLITSQEQQRGRGQHWNLSGTMNSGSSNVVNFKEQCSSLTRDSFMG